MSNKFEDLINAAKVSELLHKDFDPDDYSDDFDDDYIEFSDGEPEAED